MRKVKQNSGLWKYLTSLENYETLPDDELASYRKIYWREYARLRMQKRRSVDKREISLSLAKDYIKSLRLVAKSKGYTLQDYIRECVRADLENISVVPHKYVLAQILQVLRHCYSQLEAIKQKDTKAWFALNRTYENVNTVLDDVRKEITVLCNEPTSLRDLISESISSNPHTLVLLASIIKEHGDHKMPD
jgi:hypothetical protein